MIYGTSDFILQGVPFLFTKILQNFKISDKIYVLCYTMGKTVCLCMIGYIIKLIYINEREIKDETEGKNSSIIYGSNDNTINSY